jgi:hypothetical protein
MAARRTFVSRLAALLLVAASVVWAQARSGTAPKPAGPERARAVLQLGPDDATGERTVAVLILGEGRKVASYQATITFDRAKVSVVRASAPADAYRIVNIADTTDGRLRFAGFATDGFRQDTALNLRVRPRGSASTLDVRLEVVGDVLGKPFAATSLQHARINLPAIRRH